MTLCGAKTIFLDTWLCNNQKDITLTMVRVLLRETASLLTFIMNIISVNFIACFRIICWFLQTQNYGGNEKYVLVLIQCHDHELDKYFLRLYLVSDHHIMTLDSNQNLIFSWLYRKSENIENFMNPTTIKKRCLQFRITIPWISACIVP